MNVLKNTVITLSVALILMGFVLKMLPKSKFSGNVKNIFALLAIIIVISPFLGGVQLDFSALPDFSSSVTANGNALALNTLEYLSFQMQTDLTSNGIDVKNISIDYTLLPEGVKINCVKLNSDNFLKAKNFLESKYAITVTEID